MKLFAFAFLATAAFAADIDWSKVQPRDITADVFGFFNPHHQGRIVGGNEAPRNKFPHQAALFLQVGEATSFCGGSLISNQWVITAAHCTDGAKGATVYLGAHNVREAEADRLEIQVDSSNFIIHEKWDRSMLKNDISLIKLPSPIQFTKNIQAIKLASAADASKTFQDEKVVASGWGKDSDDATTISPVLRYVESTIFHFASCKVVYLFRPDDGQICMSGADGISTCNGDSGGPLLAFDESNGEPFLLGLTSYGSGLGCEKGYPAVFSKIPYFRSWITQRSGV